MMLCTESAGLPAPPVSSDGFHLVGRPSTHLLPPPRQRRRMSNWSKASTSEKVINGRPPILAIVGGTSANSAIARRHAYLKIFYSSSPTFYVCGGSILSAYIILTAAHCLFRPSSYSAATSIAVYAGDSIRESSPFIAAARFYVHRDYSYDDSVPVHVYKNDIAIIVLAKPIGKERFDRMQLASSWNDVPINGESVWTAGFGQTSYRGPLSSVLLETQLTRRYFGTCVQAEPIEYQGLIDKASSICATAPGFPEIGGNDSCDGDSGGPLYWYTKNGDIVQIGITSWGSTGCAEKGTVAWYSRIRSFVDGLTGIFEFPPDLSQWTVYPRQNGDEDPGARPSYTDKPHIDPFSRNS